MSGHRCILCYRLCILPKLCYNVCLFEVTIVNIQIVGRAVLVHLLIQQFLCLQQHFFHFDWSIYLQQKYCRTIGVGKEFYLRELKVVSAKLFTNLQNVGCVFRKYATYFQPSIRRYFSLAKQKNLHKIVEIFSFKIIKNATRVAVFCANWCNFTTYLVGVPFRLLRTCVAKRIQTQSATNLQKTQRSRLWLPIRTSLLHCKSKA